MIKFTAAKKEMENNLIGVKKLTEMKNVENEDEKMWLVMKRERERK